MARKNLTQQCLSEIGGQGSETFLRNNFCIRCQNKECEMSEFSNSLWESRIKTQEYRFFENPNIADIEDPRFEFVKKMNFKDLLDKAVAYEVSDQRRHNWTIPTREEIESYKASKRLPGGEPQNSQIPEGFIEQLLNQEPIDSSYGEEESQEQNLDTDENITDESLDENLEEDHIEESPILTNPQPLEHTFPVENNTVTRHMPRNTPIPIGGIVLSRKDGDTVTTPPIKRSDSRGANSPVTPPKMNWGLDTQPNTSKNITVTLGNPGTNKVTIAPSSSPKNDSPSLVKPTTKLENKKPK